MSDLHMPSSAFWSVINETVCPQDRDTQVLKLSQRVSVLSEVEYRCFLTGFLQTMNTLSERDSIINAACLALEGCISSDSFDYFCYWLIGNGSDAYDLAINNPDGIVDMMEIYGHPNLEELVSAISAGPEISNLSGLSRVKVRLSNHIWSAEKQRQLLPRLFSYSGL